MTAYEMRISDWSSDVCSSDLASGPPLERSRRFFVACKVRLMPALLPEEETMTKTVADFMLECLAADPAAPHHQEPGEELCQGAPEGRSGSARHRLAYPRASPGLKSQSEAPVARIPRSRSEEHTSELQSLMRTPYA